MDKFMQQMREAFANEALWKEFQTGIWDTIYSTVAATLVACVLGIILGIILVAGEEDGVRPLPGPVMKVLNFAINILRSVPFLILMIMVLPLSELLVGTTIGTVASIPPLIIASASFVARLVETSLREVDKGVIEAAQSMGCSPFQIIWKVILPESLPSLVASFTTAFITILGYGAMAGAIGGGGLAAGVSTLAKLLNPNVKVIGVEPEGAASMKASLEAGHVVTLDRVETIADGVAVKTPGDQIFPYIQKNIDDIITIPDDELVDAFLDMMEKHKMIVENAGLLPIAALSHLKCRGKNVVPVLSGGNMDVITMASLVQHGLIMRGRIFTFSVLLPDRPGALLSIADILARENGNVIKLEHNQFVSINRSAAVELRITLEAFGTEHKNEIIAALEKEGYQPKVVRANI